MLCNHKSSLKCFFLLAALLAALLAGCGGDDPAPAPPPPPRPPPPAFVPQDVVIELGSSGETLTLQTTETGGFTRNGEAFASGNTVEAEGNTYRLVLDNSNWAAEYVAPRPWATALGTSGDALLITRREDGLYESGEHVFSSGGTITASNGNQYMLTFVPDDDQGTWTVDYLPPEPTAIALGMSGETVLVERLEGGGYAVGGQRIVDGSTVQSAAGNTYRLSMQDGEWSASFSPPPPISVLLGASGQMVTLQIREDGQFEKDGQLYPSGSTEMVGGSTYRLVLQNGVWTAMFEAPPPVMVPLGTSGQAVTLQVREDGQFEKDGQLYPSGSTEMVGGSTYRLVLQNGVWTAMFEAPPPVVVPLGTSGESIVLQVTENGQFTKDGRPYTSGTSERTADGNTYRLTLANGMWTATFEAPATVQVQLGRSGETITLVAREDGTYTLDGQTFAPNSVVEAGGNNYRVVLQDGEWTAVYQRQSIPVVSPDGLIVLFREENGTFTYDNERVTSGDEIEYQGTTYELLQLSNGEWIADRTATTAPRQQVQLPEGAGTITLTRNDDGDYTYDGNVIDSGDEIVVSGARYRLTQSSSGTWSAALASTSPTRPPGGITEGGVGGPTQIDEAEEYAASLIDGTTTGRYSVGFLSRDDVTETDDRGILIAPNRLEEGRGSDETNRHKFSVYELMRAGLVSQQRTAAEVAKAEIEEILAKINLKKPLYEAGAAYPDNDIEDGGGLWDQAEDAVARIFGWRRTVNDDVESIDGIIGSEPWSGRLDNNEVDDVIETLQEIVAILSDVNLFAREFEDEIDDANMPGQDATDYDADDFFGSTSSRIRFGSTSGTRFGAYAVTDAGKPAAAGLWDTGVFAYTPADQPDPADIPSRGEATFRGDTVAVSRDTAETTPATDPKLYAGKIELVANFSKTQVGGTITALKDEDGSALEVESTDTFRKETVESIELPDAEGEDDPGFYNTTDGSATISFTRNLRSESVTSIFRVQLVDEATEALGIWTATDPGLDLNLEGSFGARRSGSVTAAKLPRLTDDGGEVAAASRVFLQTGGTAPVISTDDPDDENTIEIQNAILGMGRASGLENLIDWYEDFPNEWMDDLEDLHPSRSVTVRGDVYLTTARNEIRRLRDLINSSSEQDRFDIPGDNPLMTGPSTNRVEVDQIYLQTHSLAALELVFGQGNAPALSGGTAAELHTALASLYTALSSERNFATALDTAGVFVSQNRQGDPYDSAEIGDIFDARDVSFALRFASTEYTRFGVWSQSAPPSAVATLPGGNTVENGAFAYSPLEPENTTLTFVADYEGKTLAVDGRTGYLYSGTFELTVNWGDADDQNNITARIINLKGVQGTSAYFEHGSNDVGTIFLSGIGIDGEGANGVFSSTSPSIRYSYRDGREGGPDTDRSPTASIAGRFVGDEHSEGPLGVLGTWAITETNLNFRGSFGADLQP